MRNSLLAVVLALLPSAALAATPPEGAPLEVRRGFFTEADIGLFFTLGGENDYSNAQSYLQLGLGYDLSETLSVGVHFGLGASAANCFADYLPGTEVCSHADNFTMAFGDVTVAYRMTLAERLYLAPKVAAGLTRLDPSPQGNADPSQPVTTPNAGLGIGVEYVTPMDHFTVGADLLARYVFGPSLVGQGIPTFALFPRIKYTF